MEQWLQVWQDQVEHAQSLRDRRKIYAGLLTVLVGFGFFRVQLFRSKDAVPTVDPGSLVAIKWIATFSLVCLLIGAYWLFTERAQIRRLLKSCKVRLPGWTPKILKEATRIGWHPEEHADNIQQVKQLGIGEGTAQTRAITVMAVPDKTVRQFVKAPRSEAVRARIQLTRLAYGRLVIANKRVSDRIDVAIAWLGLTFLGIVSALIVYTLSAGVRYDDHGNQADTPRDLVTGVAGSGHSGGTDRSRQQDDLGSGQGDQGP